MTRICDRRVRSFAKMTHSFFINSPLLHLQGQRAGDLDGWHYVDTEPVLTVLYNLSECVTNCVCRIRLVTDLKYHFRTSVFLHLLLDGMVKFRYLIIIKTMYGFRYRKVWVCNSRVCFRKLDIEVKAYVCTVWMPYDDIKFWCSGGALDNDEY